MKNRIFDFDTILSLLFVISYSFFPNKILPLLFGIIIILIEVKNLYFRKYDKVLGMILLLIPLLGIITLNSKPILNLCILIFSIFIFLFDKKIAHSKNILVFLIILTVFDFIKYLIYFHNINGIINFLNAPMLYFSVYFGIIVYELITINNSDFKFPLKFIQGTFLSIIYGFLTRLLSGGLSFALINNDILTRNSGASGDPNYYGLYIAVSIALLIAYKFNNDKKFGFFWFFLIIVLIFFGLSSSSRMYYILILFIILVLSYLFVKKFFSKNIIKTLMVLLFGFFFVFLFRNILFSNIEYLVSRLNTSDITNGRNFLVEHYNSFVNEDPIKIIFGIGIPLYNVRAGIGLYAHNLYVELYVTQGIIGILYLFFCFILNKNKIFKINNYLFLFPLLVFIIGGFGVSYLEVDCFYTLIALLISTANRRSEKSEK